MTSNTAITVSEEHGLAFLSSGQLSAMCTFPLWWPVLASASNERWESCNSTGRLTIHYPHNATETGERGGGILWCPSHSPLPFHWVTVGAPVPFIDYCMALGSSAPLSCDQAGNLDVLVYGRGF